jgi:hypothetical protein
MGAVAGMTPAHRAYGVALRDEMGCDARPVSFMVVSPVAISLFLSTDAISAFHRW